MRTNDNAYQVIFSAAQVISLSTAAAAALGEADPKALVQLRGAIKAVQAEIDTNTALSAMAERFGSITDMTFLTVEQENCLLGLVENAAGTLSLRGRTHLSQKAGADTVRVLSKMRDDLREAVEAPLRASKKAR